MSVRRKPNDGQCRLKLLNTMERRDGMPIRLTYHHNLRLSESIDEQELKKIKKQLSQKPLLSDVYLITPARNNRDLLEFYHSRTLAWPYYQKEPPLIIGIVRTYDEALAMIEQLVRECYLSRGDCSLREYLLC